LTAMPRAMLIVASWRQVTHCYDKT